MAGASFEALKRFFETAPAAAAATRPLSREAEVGLDLEGGPARFTMASGRAELEGGAARDPDFTLAIPDAAVKHITSFARSDAGELGIEFFKLAISRDPAIKVRIRIQASTPRLVSRGYLGVLAAGGLKVGWWLLRNGVLNAKATFDRFRGR
jgi:hypothetical protein